MGNPIAFLTCYHVCPKKSGSKDHVGGKIFKAAGSVHSGGMPIARVTDKLACECGSDTIETGSAGVFCEGQPVAYVGSMTSHGGQVVEGNSTVSVGEKTSGGPYDGLLAEMLAEPMEKQAGEADSGPSVTQSTQDTITDSNQNTVAPVRSQSGTTPSPDKSLLSQPAADDEDRELIVEVLGRSHPDGHKFCFFDYQGLDPDPVSLDGKLSREPTDDSVIYRWDWTEEKDDRRLFMEIATESGDPIRVPFLHQARAIEYQDEDQDDRQKHVVVPVVASTLIAGVPKKELVSGKPPKDTNPHHHVLCRAGFLYFFYESKLWREVEVTITEDGTPHYRDVPLDTYRTGEDGKFEERYREVTGVALEEIWLPSRVLNYWQTMRVAFAESQWTGERVNFFERHTNHIDERCDLIEMEIRDQDIANGVDHFTRPLRSHVLPASVLDRQRPRAPGIEYDYDRPEEYLLTKSGLYEDDETSKALNVHSQHEDSSAYAPVPEDKRPEMNALCNVLAGTMRELDIEGVDDNLPNWEKAPVKYAPIDKIKERKIGVIRLEDRLYRVRYLLERHKAGAWFADAAVRRAKEREFFDSASLVNTVVVPEEIGGKPSPFNEHKDEMDDKGKQLLSFSMAEHERGMAVAYLAEVQDQLIELLNDSHTQNEIVELFTHYDCDYLGAFSFMTSVFQTVSKEPFECDALSGPVNDIHAYRGKRWVSDVAEGGRGALYLALFPDMKKDDLTQPYQGPTEEDLDKDRASYRSSRGIYQATKLAALEDAELPDADSLKTLDGLSVLQAAELEMTASVALAGLKPMASLLMTIQGNLISALEEANKKSLEARQEHGKLVRLQSEEQAKKLRIENEADELRREIGRLEEAENNQLRHLMDKEHRIRKLQDNRRQLPQLARQMQELDAEIASRAQAIEELGARTLALRSEYTIRLAHYLRSSMPGNFGNLKLTSYSQAVVEQSFVLGMPAALIARDYERFYKAALEGKADKEVAVKTLHAQGKGIYQEYRADVKVLTMPENEETAKTLRQLSEAETEYVQLRNELDEAKKLAKDTLFTRPGAVLQTELENTVEQRTELAKTKLDRRINLEKLEARLEASGHRLSDLTKDAQKAANDSTSAANKAAAKASSKVYRALSHPIVPIGALLLEAFNVFSMGSGIKRELRISPIRGGLKGLSATYDVALLSVTISNRFASNGSLIARRTEFLHREAFKGKVAEKIAERLGKRLLLNGALGVIGAAITAVTLSMDAAYALNLGNPAVAAANGLIATGVVSLTVFGLMGKSGVLLMMGPLGWLAVGVAAVAVGVWLLFAYSDQPIQVWLRNGPFGPEDGVDALKRSKEAYQSLLSVCMGVSARLESFESGEVEDQSDRAAAIAKSNARIVIRSPAIGLQSSIVSDDFSVKLDLVEELKRIYVEDIASVDTSRWSVSRRTPVPDHFVNDLVVLWEERTNDGLAFYIDHPSKLTQKVPVSLNTEKEYLEYEYHIKEYSWQVSAQLKLHYQDDDFIVVPGPDPEDNLPYDEKNEEHTKPDYSDKDQHFWHHTRLTLPEGA
ncbi:PAAR domain-containing protein [Marinobacter sp. M1N3S26]|uniref:PAAR domain-containing protein n=1 Tax=Marinobacter sp. M1N3S26 TaxID=3382299 RepID=UPI00387ACC5B